MRRRACCWWMALFVLAGAGATREARSQQLSMPPPPSLEWSRLPPVDTVATEAAAPAPPKPAPKKQEAVKKQEVPKKPEAVATPKPATEANDEAVVEIEPWFTPYHWIDAAQWDGSIELGLNGTDGNSEAFTLRTGGNLKRKTKIYELGGDLTYLKTNTGGIESQHRLLSNMNYERFFGETRWSYYIKSSLEYDEFKAFDVRLAGNTGLGYLLVKTDQLKFKTRFGAGASREYGGPDDDVEPEAAFGCDYDWVLSDRQKVQAVTDYYPQWDDFEDYRLSSSVNWELLLDKVANLSLKLSVSDRYDSTPNGRRPNDIDYGVLLLWKI